MAPFVSICFLILRRVGKYLNNWPGVVKSLRGPNKLPILEQTFLFGFKAGVVGEILCNHLFRAIA